MERGPKMTNRVRNLDNYYLTIDSKLRIVGAHMEDNDITFLLTMCRLKPHQENKDSKLQRWWVDEWGNSLKIRTINQYKQLHIILQDDALKSFIPTCNDLYRCLTLDKMVKMSKLLYLLIGKDDQHRDHAVIASLGIDGFLRVFTLIKGYWHNVSPLSLGSRTLHWIAHRREGKRPIYTSSSSGKVILPCLSQRVWLCCWEDQVTLQEIIKPYPFIVDALKLKEING
jgi:hypothetical protein